MSHLSITLGAEDLKAIEGLVQDIKLKVKKPTEENILASAHIYAQELPRVLRSSLHEFKAYEIADAITIKTGGFFDTSSASTPTDYVELNPDYLYNDMQIAHALMSNLIGTPVGYSSQRSGKRLNNIIPTQNLESTPNSSSGSKFNFGFHTEDAFHEFKGDYLGLVCIRNIECAVTSFVSMNEIKVSPLLKAALFRPDYVIGNNPIHVLPDGHKLSRSSILYGSWGRPYMRINVSNIYGVDRNAQYALEEFVEAMNAARECVVLEAGDFFYLDNLYTAHARDAYTPNWGSEARWLSRFIISQDVRKSAVARKDWRSLVIENDYDRTTALAN